jgi:hypothetical protein
MGVTPGARRGRTLARPALAVSFVLLVFFAGLVVIATHDGSPPSGFPILQSGSGYGTYTGYTEDSVIFYLDCRKSPAGYVEPPGFFQILSGHLSIDLTTAGSLGVASPVTFRQFRYDTRLTRFFGYVYLLGTTRQVTDARGATGCAGPIGANGKAPGG